MSIERRRRSDGRTVYAVRWYDSGRGSTKRKRTFDRRRDAELYEASIRRARQLGQLARKSSVRIQRSRSSSSSGGTPTP